jgi:acylphosphatase
VPAPAGTASPLRRVRVRIHGRVQGVFFRDTLRRRAESRGVAGWVTNRGDGTVEAVLEGRESDIEALIGFCRQGPARAEVEHVDVIPEPPEGLVGFKIE